MGFREQMVELVKAAGQELIDRAGEIVGEGEAITDFDIWLSFPIGKGKFECPEIQVMKKYINRNALDVCVRKE